MKVLHLIDSAGLYGAEMIVLSLMEEQKKMGLRPVLGSIGNRRAGEKPLEKAAREKGLEVRAFRMADGPNLAGALAVARWARGEGIDVVHSHGYKGNILMGFLPRRVKPMPLLVTLHGWTSAGKLSRMTLYEWLDRQSLRFADHVVAVSGRLLDVPSLAGILRGKFSHIPNGIPLAEGPDKAPPDQDIAAFCSEGPVVGSIGRLSPEKNYTSLVEAAGILHGEGRPVRLVLIGEGPKRAELEKRARDLGLSGKVLFAGYREDAARHLPLFDVFALPSLTEGQPVTILEAMRAGTPVIAGAVGDIPEILEGGKAGLLVEKGDVPSLARAIETLLGDEVKRGALSRRARDRVPERFGSPAMARAYVKVYRDVLGMERPG